MGEFQLEKRLTHGYSPTRHECYQPNPYPSVSLLNSSA